MSMEDLWLRQSIHGWVLFLGIKSVYIVTKVKEITEASATVGLLLATAVLPNLFRHHVFQHFGLLPVAQGGTIQA